MPTPRLETERLVLRALDDTDVDDIFRYASDPEVARHVPWDAHRTTDDTKAFLTLVRDQERAGQSVWGIAPRDQGHVVGTVALRPGQPDARAAEIGYALARSEWGHGLMTEALAAVIAYATGLAVRRLVATVWPANAASARLLDRLGFTHVGRQRRTERAGHGDETVDVYALELPHG